MRMVSLFSEDINFSVNILFRVNPHNDSSGHNILNKLVHSILNLFIVLCLLYVLFYIIKEFFLRLFSIRVKQ